MTRNRYEGSLHRSVALVVCLTLCAVSGALAGQSASVPDPARPLDTRWVFVLPFSNISGDASDEWIGAGIADTVAADLGVLGLSSVVAEVVADDDERGRPADDGLGLADDVRAREAGQRHGAAWVVTGGFQRVGEQLRVLARLLEVASGDVRRTVTLDGWADDLCRVSLQRLGSRAATWPSNSDGWADDLGWTMTDGRSGGEERRVARVVDEDVAESPAVSSRGPVRSLDWIQQIPRPMPRPLL